MLVFLPLLIRVLVILDYSITHKTLFNLYSGSEVRASACSAGDLGSIPGSEDPLEKEMATHSSILAWRIPRTEEPWDYSPWGRKELDTTE